MSTKKMWVCSDCGSINVQTKKWVNLNDETIGDDCSDGEPDDNWCIDCESHCDVSFVEDF